jgi:hypothetical protein
VKQTGDYSWGVTIPDTPKVRNLMYTQAPICVFCAQFFSGKGMDMKESAGRDESKKPVRANKVQGGKTKG